MSGRTLDFPKASKSFLALNAHLMGGSIGQMKTQAQEMAEALAKLNAKPSAGKNSSRAGGVTRAVRQQEGDGMNKAERAAFEYLRDVYFGVREPRRGNAEEFRITPHGLTFLLGNGVRFIPDVIVQAGGRIHAFEVKAMRGRRVHVEDDAAVKVKLAASIWPAVTFTLMWMNKRTGGWEMQEMLP